MTVHAVLLQYCCTAAAASVQTGLHTGQAPASIPRAHGHAPDASHHSIPTLPACLHLPSRQELHQWHCVPMLSCLLGGLFFEFGVPTHLWFRASRGPGHLLGSSVCVWHEAAISRRPGIQTRATQAVPVRSAGMYCLQYTSGACMDGRCARVHACGHARHGHMQSHISHSHAQHDHTLTHHHTALTFSHTQINTDADKLEQPRSWLSLSLRARGWTSCRTRRRRSAAS